MAVKVSLLVPALDEAECVPILVRKLGDFIGEKNLGDSLECVIIDDGSTDRTYEIARELAAKHPWLKVARHSANLGKTQALITGARLATGDILVIYDADMQYSLEDAWRLAEKAAQGWDIVSGWKQGRYHKRFVSAVYNGLSRLLFNLPIHDMNAMKAVRAEVFFHLGLRKDWHRYIVPLAVEKGFSVTEEKVALLPRVAGKSKYRGFWRIIVGIADLLAVKFQITIMRKPLLYLGTAGFASGLGGILVGVVALVLRYVYDLGFRPLLYLVILLVLAGLILITMGLLGELVAGLYDRLETGEKRP